MPKPVAAWTVADLIDFEQLLASPTGADEDRRIFDDEIAARIGAQAIDDRRTVLRAWLDARRARISEPMAGESYDTGRRSLQSAAMLLGFVGGAALAGSLLAQGGAEPVNALLFLFWAVGIQWLLLALAALAWVLRRVGVDVAPLRVLVSSALSAAGSALRRLPGERRDLLRATLARLKRRGRVGGALLKWPAFIVMQMFGIAFNLGLLFAMLFVQLPFAELRFGWQSTYELRPEQVQHAVDTMAAPWRWFAPGAQPSLADIAATRYSRGQNAQSLPSAAARSWWPFLALTVACYGLLLRAVMLGAAGAALRWQLKAVNFSDPDANALWRRLRGPLVGTRGGAATLPSAPLGPHKDGTARPAGGSCVVLLSEEMTLSDTRLRSLLHDRFGWTLQRVARVSIDDRRVAAAAVAAKDPDQPPPSAVVVVAPASRDPIVAVALFLREVIAGAGQACEVVVLLCGDSSGERLAVDAERHAIWQRFLAIEQLPVGMERCA
jgi:hypothetical protein